MKKCLIAIDGIDGSGKETQTKLLLSSLESDGIPHKYLSFPTYREPWSDLVTLYLGGGFGDSPENVNAYAASTFFACDRYCSYMLDWKKEYDAGSVIVCNRYTTGNAVHQLSKLPENEWDAFLEWLEDYEYGRLGLPKPDFVIYLSLPPETALEHIRKRSEETGREMDIHEKSAAHLEKSHRAALFAAEKLFWHTVNCSDSNGGMRTRSDIHNEITALLEKGGFLK